ncbi:gamma-glutamyl-gamma-aminobutyrate hydrolase family protein [Myxococcota bacterium]|nr:gamma-glutamyl-gamma-aminobutyrate hydrolase family protein [Myxococcota bacterium]
MIKKRPVIGTVSYGLVRDPVYLMIQNVYVRSLQLAGAQALIIPPGESNVDQLLDLLDGLLLIGGGDIDPLRYSTENNHTKIYGVDKERDNLEFELACKAIDRQMPILAICRGMQVINAACGGDLHQHLPDIFGESVLHRATERDSALHSITINEGELLAEICGTRTFDVASVHHQSVKTLGKDLRPIAYSSDGVIEALAHNLYDDLIALQWHPEHTADTDPIQQRIFDGFVQKADKSREKNLSAA